MGFKRQQITRVDKTKQAIVDGLRDYGFIVFDIGWPVDLLVRHPKWGPNRFRLLECKSHKDAKGNVKLDKRQKEQQEFCETHGVPYVTDTFEALLALGEVLDL
jgi:hypothetical protein